MNLRTYKEVFDFIATVEDPVMKLTLMFLVLNARNRNKRHNGDYVQNLD